MPTRPSASFRFSIPRLFLVSKLSLTLTWLSSGYCARVIRSRKGTISSAPSSRYIPSNRTTTRYELTSRIERGVSRVTLGREKSRCGRSGTIAFYRAVFDSPFYSSLFFLSLYHTPTLRGFLPPLSVGSGSKWVCDAHHGNPRDPSIH